MHDTMNKSELKSVRKDLRNNGTSAEATLWELIKGKQIDGLKFRWQHSVGPYFRLLLPAIPVEYRTGRRSTFYFGSNGLCG